MFRHKECKTKEEAYIKAEEQLRAFLPTGLETPSQIFNEFYVQEKSNGERIIGFLWVSYNFEYFADEQHLAWLHYLYINPADRQKGHASLANKHLLGQLEQLGQKKLWASVYVDNAPMQACFKALGYEIVKVTESYKIFERKL
jgi:ribosomal protein S18 acetylase RimI-like enzyme